MDMYRITVLGLGYVGLSTAVMFASKGCRVIGVDMDLKKIKAINSGRCYLKEPGLDVLLKTAVSKGFLRAKTDGVSTVKESDAVIIAVPTPVKDNVVDLSYLKAALETVKQGIHKNLLVVIESTVPPDTTIGFIKPILESTGLRVEKDFYLAHIPERIAAGKVIEEFQSAPRVIGGVGPRSTRKAIDLYSIVNKKLYSTDSTTAEFVKVIENTFRDLNIAYANFLALVAEKIGIDVYEAIRLANTHPRVNIHLPGSGVGGPCLTKDPFMLIQLARDITGVALVTFARRINDYMPIHMVKIIEKALRDAGLKWKDSKISILGVAYKGGVDDTRATPAETIIKKLMKRGVRVVVYDPYTNECFTAERSSSLEEAVKDTDIIVIVTDHPEFKEINLDLLAKLVRHKIIIDGRRVIEPYRAVKKGFRYYGIGFGKI